MCIAGKFPIYYYWMVLIPLTIACASCAGQDTGQIKNPFLSEKLISRLMIGSLVIASLVGLPLRLFVTCRQWAQRDYCKVETYVSANLQSNDWVFADCQAFYPVKRSIEHAFFPPYLDNLTPTEKRRLSVLVINPQNFNKYVSVIGGNWQMLSSFGSAPQTGARLAAPYFLGIYRRADFQESLNPPPQ